MERPLTAAVSLGFSGLQIRRVFFNVPTIFIQVKSRRRQQTTAMIIQSIIRDESSIGHTAGVDCNTLMDMIRRG